MGEGMRVRGVYSIKHPHFSYQILSYYILLTHALWLPQSEGMNICCGDE